MSPKHFFFAWILDQPRNSTRECFVSAVLKSAELKLGGSPGFQWSRRLSTQSCVASVGDTNFCSREKNPNSNSFGLCPRSNGQSTCACLQPTSDPSSSDIFCGNQNTRVRKNIRTKSANLLRPRWAQFGLIITKRTVGFVITNMASADASRFMVHQLRWLSVATCGRRKRFCFCPQKAVLETQTHDQWQ